MDVSILICNIFKKQPLLEFEKTCSYGARARLSHASSNALNFFAIPWDFVSICEKLGWRFRRL